MSIATELSDYEAAGFEVFLVDGALSYRTACGKVGMRDQFQAWVSRNRAMLVAILHARADRHRLQPSLLSLDALVNAMRYGTLRGVA